MSPNRRFSALQRPELRGRVQARLGHLQLLIPADLPLARAPFLALHHSSAYCRQARTALEAQIHVSLLTGEKVRVLDPKREPRRVRRHSEDNRPFLGNAQVHLFEEYVPVRVDVAEGVRVGAGFAVVAVQEVQRLRTERCGLVAIVREKKVYHDEVTLLGVAELADLVDVSYSTIYRMEKNGHLPRRKTVQAVAKVLRVKPNEIVTDSLAGAAR